MCQTHYQIARNFVVSFWQYVVQHNPNPFLIMKDFITRCHLKRTPIIVFLRTLDLQCPSSLDLWWRIMLA